MEGNNLSEKIAFLREAFLEAEREYLKELMRDPRHKLLVDMLKERDAGKLSKEAMRRIDDIEMGRVKEEDLERVEAEITLIFAAIEDCIRDRVREITRGDYEDDLER